MDHLGFAVGSSSVLGNTLVPRYYNPEIPARLSELEARRELLVLGHLIDNEQVSVAAGDEIGKMAYGTGRIPFVRTSDLVNYEVKGEPKQGVSRDIYEQYAERQGVEEGDVLFVRDGTYLIGNTAMVTRWDLPMLYQSHLLRFRVAADAPIDPHLFLAAMNAPIVRRQLRSKQFTADIIDTVGNRYREVRLPIPIDPRERERISMAVRDAVGGRADLLRRLKYLPVWLEGTLPPNDYTPLDEEAIEDVSASGWMVQSATVGRQPLIPRYYSPRVDARLRELAESHDLTSLGQLVDEGKIEWSTGIEVGKMAYGGGGPPFVRTSDLSTWELKVDPKQTVTADTYAQFGERQDVRPNDILLVRDGTYLVGSSAIVTEADGQLLFAGGLYKLRAKAIDPFLLLALLNTPVVRKQIRTKQFTRDVIDTLGRRLFEVYLPIPRDIELREWITSEARAAVSRRVELRTVLHDAALAVEGDATAAQEEAELDAVPA